MEDKEVRPESPVQELLSSIQRKLKAPKSQFNSFGNYHYRNCEDIIEAVKPLLPDGAAVVINDSIEMIGSRYYIKSTAHLHYMGFGIPSYGWAREPESRKGMDESQITGATSSYARKYALNGLFLIDDTKDADSKDNSAVKPEKGPVMRDRLPASPTPQVQDNSGSFIIPFGYSKGEPVHALSDKNIAWYLNSYLEKIQKDPNSRFRQEWDDAVEALQAEKDARTGSEPMEE